MRIISVVIIAFFHFFLLSCGNQPHNGKNDSIQTEENVQKNDNDLFSMPINDSITSFCDSVIGKFKVRYYTRNDSTERFVPGPLQRDTNQELKVDSTTLPYARKACLFVCEGNRVHQKEITRIELQKTINVEDLEYFQIHTITIKSSNKDSLLFTVSLSMDDTLYFFEFDYEYHNGKFTLIRCRMFDDEGVEEIKV